MPVCDCEPDDCWFVDAGYPWCRSCREHHRPPECPINEDGESLARCGHPWSLVDADLDPCDEATAAPPTVSISAQDVDTMRAATSYSTNGSEITATFADE